MDIAISSDENQWESFLQAQPWSPFLQSWTMGEVYREIGEEPIRLEIRDGGEIVGVCQAIVVPARRGKHLAVMYGPVVRKAVMEMFVEEMNNISREKDCAFIRMSPFCASDDDQVSEFKKLGFRSSPLHLLAEHIWYLDLKGKSEDEVLIGMRKTTRNLVRRAEREGVSVTASDDPVRDLSVFFELYDETRKRHHFVPYPDKFIRAQVEEFASKDQCRLYIARFNNEPVAASVHMIYGGETSYHHGASTAKYPKCFASYLLQWTAIKEAIARGDHIYNFWGVSPEGVRKHPFSGVRTFKTGFGGQLMELMHCMDLPVSPKYWKTFAIEKIRKWKRGF